MKITQADPNKLEKQQEWLQLFLKYINARSIETHIKDEVYKFQAVDHFLAHFNIDATDLAGNLDRSILNNDMVGSANYFPRKMLIIYAQSYPEESRTILKNLYNENRDVIKRITETKEQFEILESKRAKERGQKGDLTFIGLRFISLLLSYMYPDKHNAIKPAEWKVFARYIDPKFSMPQHTPAGEQYKLYSQYIEQLREFLMSRNEIKEINDRFTDGLSFKDKEFRWTTYDVIFVTARVYADTQSEAAADLITTEAIVSGDSNGDNYVNDTEEFNTGFMPFEQHLEEYVVKNWHNIPFGEKLGLYVGDDGTTGQQFTTDVGIIDILAQDEKNDYVVIELKRAESGYKVVGQVLNYMGWVKENLATDGQKVRGMIIVGRADKTLIAATRPVSEIITLKEYSIKMNLENITERQSDG